MFSLQSKIALVTGGGSGIGKAIAIELAKQGAQCHILELNIDGANSVVEEIKQLKGKAFAHKIDVSNQSEVVKLFKEIQTVDILVNNAGIAHIGNAEDTSVDDFEKIINVNVKGAYNCMHAAIPLMKKRGGGVILNMSSVAAHVGIRDRFAYSMSKGAVHAMSLSVAKDFIHHGIRCNTISPARVHTPFVDGFLGKNYPGKEKEMFEALSKTQPIGRMGTPEEVAKLALFLASDEASFVTGCDYAIDGGFIKLKN